MPLICQADGHSVIQPHCHHRTQIKCTKWKRKFPSQHRCAALRWWNRKIIANIAIPISYINFTFIYEIGFRSVKKQTSKYERRRERGTAINPDKNFKWLIKLTLMPCINILCICLSACAANVGSFVCRQIVCIDTQRSQYTIQYKLTILMMDTMRSMRRKNAVEQPHKRNSLQMHKMFDVKQTHLFVCSLSLSPRVLPLYGHFDVNLCAKCTCTI